MPKAPSAEASREKVRKHREGLRRQGLRPLQIWVPDVTTQEFRSEAHRQSAAVGGSVHAQADQAFIDSISDGTSE